MTIFNQILHDGGNGNSGSREDNKHFNLNYHACYSAIKQCKIQSAQHSNND